MTPDDLLQEAGILRSWGFSAFPVAGKKPRCKWGIFQRRKPSDRELSRLFALPDVDGIGVIPGPLSGGFAVRDFDDADAYWRWAKVHPNLAAVVPTVKTSRGYHVWHRTTAHVYRRLSDGEYIADGRHYTIVPPTRHPKGTLYEWLTGPPLGPSEFPLLDPYEAGFLPSRVLHKLHDLDIRHSSSSLPSSASPCLGEDVGKIVEIEIAECIRRTLPTRTNERNHWVFQFARALRDHIKDDTKPGVLYDAVYEWWRLALSVIGTKDFTTTLNDFRRAWASVRVSMANSRPMRALRAGAASADTPRERLLAACRALEAENGGVFFLSVRTAGEVVGISKSGAAELLRKAVADGDLQVVRKGSPSRNRRKGTTVYQIGMH